MLKNFQSTTIHVLKSSFVKAIDKLSNIRHSPYDDDEQTRIKQLLLEKEKIIRERKSMYKKTVIPHKTSVYTYGMQGSMKAKWELQTVIKVLYGLRLVDVQCNV